MNRTQMILAIVLLVQVVLIATFYSTDRAEGAAAPPHPLMPELATIQPTKILLEGQDDGSLSLSKTGDSWSVDDADGFPANQEKVANLLDSLLGISVQRPVLSNSRYHASLEVAEEKPRARVKIFGAGSEPEVDLIVGSSSNYRVTHVRLAKDDEVYEARGLNAYDLSVDGGAWIERKLAGVSFDDVTGARVHNESGEFEIEKVDGVWKPVSPAETQASLDPTKTDSFVRALTSMTITDPVGRVDALAHGFVAPAATITMKTAESEVELKIGGLTGEEGNKRYMTRTGFGFTGTIWKATVSRFVEKGIEDLLVDEEPQE